VHWFVDADKVPANVQDAATIAAPHTLAQYFNAGDVCLLDEAQANVALAHTLQQAGVVLRGLEDPCTLPRACKTTAELQGITAAHVRDGVALCKLLYWLTQQTPTQLTELHIVDKLLQLRQQGEHFIEPSFDTICGADANGAIVHYRVSETTNRTLHNNTLLLLDSGGQYLDGTTDVTRTIAIGTPTAAMRTHYTLVLQGHRALARVVWPQKSRVCGSHLDVLARGALWQHGLDYDHGTGHGVGACLSVHEGPQSISLRGQTVLQAGMVVSNEPAFYQTDAYGIRIENLQYVTKIEPPTPNAHPLLGFYELTLVPYDRRLIDVTLLSPQQITDINAYHARVYQAIAPHLTAPEAAFLQAATAPLG
jgi:Xaa-Pro aminopeptidase